MIMNQWAFTQPIRAQYVRNNHWRDKGDKTNIYFIIDCVILRSTLLSLENCWVFTSFLMTTIDDSVVQWWFIGESNGTWNDFLHLHFQTVFSLCRKAEVNWIEYEVNKPKQLRESSNILWNWEKGRKMHDNASLWMYFIWIETRKMFDYYTMRHFGTVWFSFSSLYFTTNGQIPRNVRQIRKIPLEIHGDAIKKFYYLLFIALFKLSGNSATFWVELMKSPKVDILLCEQDR